MYYVHFGLNEAPFRITPNTDVFFAGGKMATRHKAVLADVKTHQRLACAIQFIGQIIRGVPTVLFTQDAVPGDARDAFLRVPLVFRDRAARVSYRANLAANRIGVGRLETKRAGLFSQKIP